MLELKPDLEKVCERYRAFWAREIIDRPPVDIKLWKPGARPFPPKSYADIREYWLDIDYRIEKAAYEAENMLYLGDSIPNVFPNFGPGIYSAWCGCPIRFSEWTTWTEPCITDWEKDRPKARLDMNNELFRALDRITDGLLETGRGKFWTGLTDFHCGGDHLAALRGPENLALDLLENTDYVKLELAESNREYFRAYDYFYRKIKNSGSLATTWMCSLHGEGRFYVACNDFSCMISSEMFDDVFLPGIIEECRFYDQSVYHLDGPGALQHLDSILEIPELDAVQWEFGEGNEGFDRWAPVYKRIQQAGKCVVLLHNDISELPQIFETLRPEGVYFGLLRGIDNEETAQEVLKRIEKWQ